MKTKFISFVLLSLIYSQCDNLNEVNCISNNNCDWVEDIEYGNCSEFDQNSSACEATLGCWGSYLYPGWYSGWYCAGGTYIISDNSYCEDINIYECSDMNELECNSDNACDWIINESFADCNDFYNEAQCGTYPDECIWEENIVNNSCANLSQSECSQYDGCVWD